MPYFSMDDKTCFHVVQNEMKSYIGSTESDDFLKSKGSKSYRDYYLKKLHELEMQNKNYSERLQDVNVRW